jgi:hypothetical protein
MGVHRDHDIAYLSENEFLGAISESHEGIAGFVIDLFLEVSDGFVRWKFYVRITRLTQNMVPEFNFGHVAKRASELVVQSWFVIGRYCRHIGVPVPGNLKVT